MKVQNAKCKTLEILRFLVQKGDMLHRNSLTTFGPEFDLEGRADGFRNGNVRNLDILEKRNKILPFFQFSEVKNKVN